LKLKAKKFIFLMVFWIYPENFFSKKNTPPIKEKEKGLEYSTNEKFL